MDSAISSFLKHLETNNYSNNSVISYQRNLKMFSTYFHPKGPEELSFADIEAFKEFVAGRFGAGSTNLMVYSLRSFFKYLKKTGIELKFDYKEITGVKNSSGPKRLPDMTEIVSILSAPSKFEHKRLAKLRNRAILEVLFATGARISEVLSIKREDLDENGTILVLGKGQKRRNLFLNERSKHYLQAYLDKRKDDSPYLFVPTRGRNGEKIRENLDDSTVRTQISGYLKKLQLDVNVTIHTLRAAFATYRLEHGANLATIQQALGHSSISTTQRYLGLSSKFIQEDLDRADPLRKV